MHVSNSMKLIHLIVLLQLIICHHCFSGMQPFLNIDSYNRIQVRYNSYLRIGPIADASITQLAVGDGSVDQSGQPVLG